MDKKFTHTIKIINKLKKTKSNNELFNEYKDLILNFAKKVALINFDFDVKIDIVIIEQETKQLINDEIEDAGVYFKDNFVFCLHSNVLKSAKYDSDKNLAMSIIHEFAHIYDLYKIMHNKYYSINPSLISHKRIVDSGIAIGARFWTEIFAYRATFMHFSENYPTKPQLAQAVEQLDKEYKIIFDEYAKNGKANNSANVKQYIKKVNEFIYVFSKHIAGMIFSVSKRENYCEKTLKKESFKFVQKTFVGLLNKIEPLFINTYGKGMAKKLWYLGKYIVEHIYHRFNLNIIKHHGRTRTICYL